MKKTALALTLALGFTFQTFAQDSQITWGMVSSSVEKSDAAIQNDKKKLKANTWLERERVYTRLYYFDLNGVMPGLDKTQLALMKQGEPTSKETVNGSEIWKYERINFILKDGKVTGWQYPAPFREKPLLVSAEALKKTEELDPNGKMNSKIAERAKDLANYLRIAGSIAYSQENYKECLSYFSSVIELNSLKSVNTVDTVLYNDCGVVAKLAGDTESAVKYFLSAADLGYKSDALYGESARLYLENKDTAKAIATLEKGIEKFPTPNIINEMINIYLSTGKNEQALTYLEKAIEKEPSNPNYYFAQGALYEKIDADKAVASYLKAIEIDPMFVDAYLNLGASYYNKGIAHFQAANDAKNDKLYETEKTNAEAEYKKAMPYLEKILELEKASTETKKNAAYSLKNIYYKLGMYDESKKMKTLYESL